MKKIICRAATIVLILCFSISALLYFFFDAAQFRDKVLAHNRFSATKDIQTIKIPLKDIKEIAGKDEVWYEGRLYDIGSYTINNDTVRFSVLHDNEEEGLVNTLISSIDPNDRYLPDNAPHIVKHCSHIPNDGKVLSSRFSMDPVAFFTTTPMQSCVLSMYASLQQPGVIKPPPQAC